MSVIFFLIAIGVLIAGGFLFAFIWSVKSGQYDDDYTPSVRMLFDNPGADDVSPENNHSENNNNNKEQADQSINNKS